MDKVTEEQIQLIKAFFSMHKEREQSYVGSVALSEVTDDPVYAFTLEDVHRTLDKFLLEQ